MTRRRSRWRGRRTRSRAPLLRGALGLSIALAGCGGLHGSAGPRPVAGVASAEHVTAAPKLVELEVVVRPRPDGKSPRLELEVTARSDDLPRRFVVQRAWSGEEDVVERIGDVWGTCDGKEVGVLPVDDLETHLGWTFPARCKQATIGYSVGSAPNGLEWGYEFDVVVTQALTTAIAETALLLPDCPDDTRAQARVRFDLTYMPPGSEAAWSLGDGVAETTTRGARHSYLAAGKFVTIKHEAANLALEARFAGDVHFDTAAASRDLVRVLSTLGKVFQDDRPESLRMLLIGMPALHGTSHGTSLSSSAVLWFDGFEKWDEAHARLATHEAFHLYNGQVIRRRGPDEHTYFFSEGFTEHYTDEIMLRAGIFSAREWFESVRFRLREYHAHPEAETPNETADMKWGGNAMQLPYLRGSLVAAWVDREMRVQSKGKRSLDDFMRKLLARARAGKPPLDALEILALMEEEIGADAVKTVRGFLLDGVRVALPPDAFGACVEVVGTGKDTDLKVKPGVDLHKCMKAGR